MARSFPAVHIDVLSLAADAKNEGFEILIRAGRLALDRLGRDVEEVAGARLDAVGSARTEFESPSHG